MRHSLLLIGGIFLFIAGCSTGKNALKKGDYDKAVLQAVNRLRSDADNEKAIATLRKAYPLAVSSHRRKITTVNASPDPYKYEKVVREYMAINRLGEEIQRCPACLEVIPNPEMLTTELNDARMDAAEQRYALAIEALKEKQYRPKAIEAHKHLQEVQRLYPAYRDTEQLLNEALYHATLKVVVEPVPAPNRALQLNQEFFNNKLNEYLHRHSVNPYVRFYTPAEVKSENLQRVDHRIEMSFDQFALGNIISHTEVREVSRDSVVLSEEDGKKIYGTVKAQFKTHEKAIVGSGLLDFQIYDLSLNKVISQEKFPSEYRWGVVWATYNGDERALTKEQRDLVNRRELPIPNPQYMFEEFAAPLYDQAVRKIRDYYRNY